MTVRRQVLAEPDIDLGDKTWARLTDGTPLVTGAQQGKGWVVLVHTTANADWSSLAMSGLFVEMLQRMVELSEGFVETAAEQALPPLETLDGYGHLSTPPAIAVAATPSEIAIGAAEPRHPPGYYGRGNTRRALNISAGIVIYEALGAIPFGVIETGFVRVARDRSEAVAAGAGGGSAGRRSYSSPWRCAVSWDGGARRGWRASRFCWRCP